MDEGKEEAEEIPFSMKHCSFYSLLATYLGFQVKGIRRVQ